ncbi:hypothetical protein EDD17DRAFT_1764799 [Pisolithus thermaeus]|nr:hypothetical protein EV401DRAFT_2083915 [Pisolithus croceorrhizus]KAI6154514.1 hypothetical protein EDD17DRAFT_1764799 [Pisolithus thermaeus]
MPFGDGVGGAVSGDSSTLRESVYPLLVASPALSGSFRVISQCVSSLLTQLLCCPPNQL